MFLTHLANSGLRLPLLAGTPLPNTFNISVLIEIQLKFAKALALCSFIRNKIKIFVEIGQNCTDIGYAC